MKNFITTVLVGVTVTGWLLSGPAEAQRAQWGEVKSKHFLVYYLDPSHRSIAGRVSRKAESYYRKIGRTIGYTRFNNFWTWDERVKILLYPNQQVFMQSTGQPAWSLGFVARDEYMFRTKTIVSYPQESEFVDGVLPHEISHLIIRDFVQFKPLPVWFEEGVAQLQEQSKSDEARKIMRQLIGQEQYIPLQVLMNWNIAQEKDARKVTVFYAQSLSIVEFMLTRYGSTAFGRFCRYLSEGRNFSDALRSTYTNSLNSLSELEEKWVQYMKNQ